MSLKQGLLQSIAMAQKKSKNEKRECTIRQIQFHIYSIK